MFDGWVRRKSVEGCNEKELAYTLGRAAIGKTTRAPSEVYYSLTLKKMEQRVVELWNIKTFPNEEEMQKDMKRDGQNISLDRWKTYILETRFLICVI